MSRSLLLALVLTIAAAVGIAAQQRFRAGIELVSLTVTATDVSGKFVTDLNEGDFEVYEDGAKQQITFFSKSQQPISLALLLDTSASMEERMGIVQEAAVGFAHELHKDDQAEVVDFDSQVRILSPFTHDAGALEKAIRSTTANGSTSLYNAIYISLKDLKKARAASPDDIRRQAIVLLSDGDDTSSLVEFDEVLDLAKRSETAIYSIGLRQGETGRREFKEAEFVLKQLSQETGGHVFFPTDARELPKIYQAIWEELSSQYTIAYSSSNPKRDGAWRRIQIRTQRPGVIARTKTGYYGPTATASDPK
ncbi:MAG TPA: VWA domain-containing protein [Vicinamibacterales bacterium]|jgi:Ca-activated chloride channel family protein|nr:VWA domain-containing protein [Vicinamibacterales bacterium]